MTNGLGLRLASGAVGAGVLTTIHQAAQRVRDDAPRMDLVGMRVMARGMAESGAEVPDDDHLYNLTLAGDLVSNAVYYSAIPATTRKATWRRAIGLGLIAGVGALMLPRYFGAGDPPHSDSVANQLMTVAWYLAGALATAAAADLMRRDVFTGEWQQPRLPL